jgi:integrase
MRRRSIITVGSGEAEVKIYTLRRKDGYPSLQCVWYELGQRKTKTLASLDAAKLFAQQTISSCRHELPSADPVTQRDFELMRTCEARAKRFGLNVVSAFEEWSDAKMGMKGGSILDAVRFYNAHHLGLPTKLFKDVADEFTAAKEAAGISHAYRRSLRHYLSWLKRDFGPQPLADITTPQVDEWLRAANGNHTTKNNLRRIFVTLFKWSRDSGYLPQDRKTAPERAMTFNGPELAPAIFTPAELRKILAVCPANLMPHIVIGAFSGIRAAEIERLDWKDVLWDRGYIEIKAAKAKTKARRLVPLLPNLQAWLEPLRKAEGPVCCVPNIHFRLNYLGEKAGIGWRQNALRHSYASYRLADTPDAARVALEMGNSPDKLFRHYRELVTPDAAKEWFATMPPAAVDVAQVA